MPAVQPKPPPKPSPADTTLQNIIQRLENQQAKASQDKTSTPAPPQVAPLKPAEKKEAKEDKWQSFSEDKQKKVYENTVCGALLLPAVTDC
jgi:[histone H3]-lysine36 N-trimethyltransferase